MENADGEGIPGRHEPEVALKEVHLRQGVVCERDPYRPAQRADNAGGDREKRMRSCH